ncbi:DegV family EDD domain-containing protein [Anaerocolumna sedimenticola]|uniref:DegV family EDD domain-containing protein n=1 Tax=Anaerocolumna sedimenticola TaxID=2696063 RepID=A0A6P1TP72_9FIRM|nr:DegV family protein [Anaerocolumna sedimenticola]QHQ62784.1 DegV family EDD domain-containing protein [Anaerocolumna sedimenticola]
MKDYVIITESTADLSQDMIDELGIKVMPMAFELNGKSYMHYPDTREMNIHEFYQRLKKGEKSVTSLINTEAFLEFFEPILKDGKDILYIAFSSGLSGTYNSSLLAREELLEKYEDAKIICIDSKAACAGEGLLVYSAVKKKEEGLNLLELGSWLEQNILKLCHWFTVDDLNHLKRGGRVSAFSAGIGTALNVKPILHVDNEGHLIPMEKVRGRKKSLYALLDHMIDTCAPAKGQVVFIGHGDTYEDAEFLADLIREKFDVQDIIINPIGPIIGTHSGPGTIALFFFGTQR